MTSMTVALAEALDLQRDVDALATVDLRRGAVLVSSARDEPSLEAVVLLAQSAADLGCAPRLDGAPGDEVLARETLVVSEAAVHVFVRASHDLQRGVVGVARASANVALLLASVRALAGRCEEKK